MYPYLGDFPTTTTTIFLPFHTFDANGASITITGLAVTDIEVYRDASMTQRASDNGFALVDTDGIDLDGFTGIHGITLDLSDNSTAGFYAAGHEYVVVISAVGVESQTVRFIAGAFSIERAGGVLELLKSGTFGLSVLKTETASIQSDTNDIQTRLPAALVSGRMDSSTGAMAANVMTAAAAAADLTTELQSGLATAASQTTIIGYLDTEIAAILAAVDTEVAAIKGVTDKLDDTLVDQGGSVYGFTAAALEDAPTGGGGGTGLVASGTALAGGADTIQLAAASTSVDNQFRLNKILITGGTGVGQSRVLISGVTSTETYTVNEPWVIVPNATSTYDIMANGENAATLDDIAGAVHGADPADFTAPNTFGGDGYPSNIKFINDDGVAATVMETFFDGTTMSLANVTIGTITTYTGNTKQTGDAYLRLGAPAGASHAADVAAVKAETATILADTNELQTDWANGGRLDLLIDGVATAAALTTVGTNVSTVLSNLAIVDGIVDTIVAKTNQLTFSVSLQLDANAKSFNSNPVGGGGAVPFTRA